MGGRDGHRVPTTGPDGPLARAGVRPHGIDPLGRAFVNVRMHNVGRAPGCEHTDGLARVIAVLVRTAEGDGYLMHRRGYMERMNWISIHGKNKPPWGRSDLSLTSVTLALARPRPGDEPPKMTFASYEATLRPPGYPQSVSWRGSP